MIRSYPCMIFAAISASPLCRAVSSCGARSLSRMVRKNSWVDS